MNYGSQSDLSSIETTTQGEPIAPYLRHAVDARAVGGRRARGRPRLCDARAGGREHAGGRARARAVEPRA